MAKIFIDTNILLDFYRSNEETLEVLSQLLKYKEHVIFPTHEFNEFKRNRAAQLDKIIQSFKDATKLNHTSSSIIKSFPEFIKLNEAKKKYQKVAKEIIGKIEALKINLTLDKVYVLVTNLYNSDEVLKPNMDDEIIKKARKRQLLGNPPGDNKVTIGDEVIWESIINNVKDDLVIVSRDKTYKNNYLVLDGEYHELTGKNILKITDKITDGLIAIGIQPENKVVRIEEKQVKNDLTKVVNKRLWDFGSGSDNANIVFLSGNNTSPFFIIPSGSDTISLSSLEFTADNPCPNCASSWNGVSCNNCGWEVNE